MKTCPTCGNSFSDELSYCLQDGTVLGERTTSDITDRPTEIYHPTTGQRTDISTAETIPSYGGQNVIPTAPPPSPPKEFRISAIEPKSKMGCAVSIGAVSGTLAVIFALGVVGLIFRGSNDRAALEPKPTAANSSGANAANIPMAANVGPTPAATTTPLAMRSPVANSAAKTVSGGVLNGKATFLPKPPYPPAARAVRASGSVSVQVIVSESGEVLSATAVSGHVLLRSAAESAAREARFSPTILSGKPVKVSGVLTYNFVPER